MAESNSESPTPSSFGPMRSTPCDDQVGGFDWMVLVAAILCALVCALGLNTMLQCVFQCASRVLTQPLQWMASRRLNCGLKKKEMVALPTSTFTNSPSPSSPSTCVICLAEFCDGDPIRFLPNCNHFFHVLCIDKWLLSHSSCPTCRHLLNPNHHHLHSLHTVITT
ncbi:RING-H2 finger protein ATL74 [Vigna radiata var. radiata]|uniref:RING-type E3 ubiquitin transferase n=1 Tax=Vigna radiata var. radiata TaxID=3916 RepID=A0A1S3UQT7_VIGRR|nr:RING-H2 finger protein ATL74 [Vigna radiata var. radiata]